MTPPRTLPMRRWLALALVLAFVVPTVVTFSAAVAFIWVPSHNRVSPVARLRAGAAQWDDPVWQTATAATLARDRVDFVLLEDGREIYRSVPDPLATANVATSNGSEHGPPWWADQGGRLTQRLELPGAPQRVAIIYSPPGGVSGGRYWLFPVVGFSTLLLTLATIAWVLGRAINAPLAATSRAARQVAAGDLDVNLPSSRVREVAEVNRAFESMSAALRATLERQTELEQERRLFIGAIVHDLRTPLFALRGYLEGFEQGLAETPEKRARYIAVAREKAAALERLISDLFDYTRLEYLDKAPNREPLDLGGLLRRLVDGSQPQAEAKSIQIVLDVPQAACVVDGDSHLLTRAVENLLDNALRHTPSGGTVRVACFCNPQGAWFTVADSGPGIPPGDLPHLFTPLFRGETSRNRRTGGAGLGLTIARRILQAHGGDLTAANGATGGALFTGELPSAR
jgi:signal transduction histidine kinase